MSYYKITVDFYKDNDDENKYISSEIYKQEVSDLNLLAVTAPIKYIPHLDHYSIQLNDGGVVKHPDGSIHLVRYRVR